MHIGMNGKKRFDKSDLTGVRNLVSFCGNVTEQFKGHPLAVAAEDAMSKLEVLEVKIVQYNANGKAKKEAAKEQAADTN